MRETSQLSLSEADALLRPYLDGPASSILAVSGGPDSVALMRFAARMRTLGRTVAATVATVDHGLRPDSRQEAEQVAAWADDLGLRHRILTWTGEKPRTRIQERARSARYDLLAGLMRDIGAVRILTAHTLDDQAETVLMRFAAGSGIGGLGGMEREALHGDVTLCRPFLAVLKGRLLATCAAEGWPFLDDPSNRDPRFARARLRRVMATLAAEGLTAARVAALATRARRMDEALEHAATAAYARLLVAEGAGRVTLDGGALQAEPVEIVVRVLRSLIQRVGTPDGAPRLARVERLAGDILRATLDHGEVLRATLGGALFDLRRSGRLVVTPEPPRRARQPAR